MIDPGRPFTRRFGEVVAAFEDRLRNGVEQPATLAVTFSLAVTTYALPTALESVTLVTGVMNRQFTTFAEGTDYRVDGNQLVWINTAAPPDDGTQLSVDYVYREPPSGLTDLNVGSVAGTLARAFARELALLYEQMNEAYRRAFIDTAGGVALDNVVALLHVARHTAIAATGAVTFSRKSPAQQTYAIPAGTKVADKSGRVFATTEAASIPPPGAPLTTLSVSVKIVAQNPGPDGNVQANTITVMPTPPPGVDGVTNPQETAGGQDPEPDDRLRDRAKHELERAGNATLHAIKYAVLAVPGVSGVEVIDRSVDSSIPLGEVRVRYAVAVNDTVNAGAVLDAIDKTRAAGIVAVPDHVAEVDISGTFVVIPAGAAVPAQAGPALIAQVAAAVAALPIGAPLGVRKLSALAYGISGIADVAEAQLRFSRPDPNDPNNTLQGAVTDPFPVARTEIVRLDAASVKVVVLRSFSAAPPTPGAGPVARVVAVQLLDTNNAAVPFVDYTIDVDVAINAFSKASPNDPPVQLAKPRASLHFAGSATAQLSIMAADLAAFNPATQKAQLDLVISAAAYPALNATTAHTNWP